MFISLKRVYVPATDDDGFRVLVDRLWPRGVSKEKAHLDLWDRDAAPSDELRKWFNHEPSKYEEFRRRYRAELAESGAAAALLEQLKGHDHVTLVYGARDEVHNQAVVLGELLREFSGSTGRG